MKNATQPAAGESLLNYNMKRIKMHQKATRRQQKHDMLLTFMSQAVPRIKSTPPPTRKRSSFLRSILSMFL